MRTLFTALAIVFLIVAIICFIACLVSVMKVLDNTVPGIGAKVIKTATGTVTDVSEVGSSSTGRSGRVYNSLETRVTIQFHDEKGHLYEINCNPMFKNFKKGSTYKVFYQENSWDEQDAIDAEKDAKEKGKDIRPISVTGTPKSVFLWLERPLLFFVIGIVALIVMLAPIAFRHYEP